MLVRVWLNIKISSLQVSHDDEKFTHEVIYFHIKLFIFFISHVTVEHLNV